MKIITLLLTALLSTPAMAECFLTSELDGRGNKNVACTTGFVPANKLCSTPIVNGKQWTIGEDLIDNKDGTCSISVSQQSDREARELEEQNIRDLANTVRETKFNSIKGRCDTASGLLKDICEHITE